MRKMIQMGFEMLNVFFIAFENDNSLPSFFYKDFWPSLENRLKISALILGWLIGFYISDRKMKKQIKKDKEKAEKDSQFWKRWN